MQVLIYLFAFMLGAFCAGVYEKYFVNLIVENKIPFLQGFFISTFSHGLSGFIIIKELHNILFDKEPFLLLFYIAVGFLAIRTIFNIFWTIELFNKISITKG